MFVSGLTAQEEIILQALIEGGEDSADMLVARTGIGDITVVQTALDRLVSLNYVVRMDSAGTPRYRAVAQPSR